MKIDLSMLEGDERAAISTQIQQQCFADGLMWYNGSLNISNLDKPYLFLDHIHITHIKDREYFTQHPAEELTYRKFLRTTSDTEATNPKDATASSRLDLTLFPDTARAYGALAFTEGDFKYGRYNYRDVGVSASVYIAALGRHISKYYNGEWCDKKTKIPHLASALACVSIIIDAHECGVLTDDRPIAVDMDRLLTEFEGIVERLRDISPNKVARRCHE